jgi:ribosomal protein S18 acetylase RimI-like enzyme
MAAVLTLAGMGDLDKVAPLVAAFHAEEALTTTEPQRLAAVTHILEGTSLGALYLIGPRVAPIGYVVVAHGFSIEFGGLDAFIEGIYIRPPMRGKGIGGESLLQMCKILEAGGNKVVHLEVDQTNTTAQQLYSRGGFGLRANYNLMSKELR